MHARKTDPFTSHLAAKENEKFRDIQVMMIAKELKRFRLPRTSAELSILSGLDRHMCGRRMIDTERRGWIERCEARKCAETNKICITWRYKR